MPLRTWAPWLGLSERNGDAPDGGEVWRGEWGGAVKTKRVRIAVAIDHNGVWEARGYLNQSESEEGTPDEDTARESVLAEMSYRVAAPPRIVWVEADVPVPDLPSESTVVGSVSLEPTSGLTKKFMSPGMFIFDPSYKILFATSHKPETKIDDKGIWRRILASRPIQLSIRSDAGDLALRLAMYIALKRVP